MSVDAVLIAGPTASGKSAAALALAERLGGIVINVDSMQVYREARILTARPGLEEEARAPHRLYGHVGVDDAYSVARYLADAERAWREAKGRLAIFVGGTGLYFGALTEGLAHIPAVPADVRKRVQARRKAVGADAFFAELAARDPQAAALLRASDSQRVLRAYEVHEATGRPLCEWQKARPLAGLLAGLRLARFIISPPRAELHRWIDRRFGRMLEAGAMEEAGALAGLDPARPASKILGLRELWAVQAGTMSLEEARAAAQAATRRYAKRQLTWFRHRMADWTWVETGSFGNLLTEIMSQVT